MADWSSLTRSPHFTNFVRVEMKGLPPDFKCRNQIPTEDQKQQNYALMNAQRMQPAVQIAEKGVLGICDNVGDKVRTKAVVRGSKERAKVRLSDSRLIAKARAFMSQDEAFAEFQRDSILINPNDPITTSKE